jgi:oligopeptide/dipeptide ABC transporter ATP-binding protein
MQKIRGKEISMIFQEPMTSLNPVMQIGRQITEAIKYHENVTKYEAWDKAVEMLKLVGVPSPERRVKEYPHNLSGGMRQRVMIGMALSCNPKLMIADEPTTALDVTIQAQILDLMNKLKEEVGTSIILITHDLGVVAEMVEQLCVMYAGVVVESGNVTNLFNDPLHPYTKGLLRCIPKMDEANEFKRPLRTIKGVVPNLLHLPIGCPFQERCDQAEECDKKSQFPPLEEVREKHWVRCWYYKELG